MDGPEQGGDDVSCIENGVRDSRGSGEEAVAVELSMSAEEGKHLEMEVLVGMFRENIGKFSCA